MSSSMTNYGNNVNGTLSRPLLYYDHKKTIDSSSLTADVVVDEFAKIQDDHYRRIHGRMDDSTAQTQTFVWHSPHGKTMHELAVGGTLTSIVNGRAMVTSPLINRNMQVQAGDSFFIATDNPVNLNWDIEEDVTAVSYYVKQTEVPDGDASCCFKYSAGMDSGELGHWPFDNPKSNYVLHNETFPMASGRTDHTSSTTRTGIWRCTKGIMECTEQGDELMTILSGQVEVTDKSMGQTVVLRQGDSMFSFNGKRVVWNVLDDVTKVFFGFKRDGFS